MVIDVAKQETGVGLVNDQADVAAHAHRPEVLVLRLFELVESAVPDGRVQLQVESRRLDRLLLVSGQPGEAVGERVCDPEFHQLHLEHLHHLVAKVLMTFTAMRPDLGLSKGREVSLFSVAQASSLISAFRVVFSAL